MDILHLLLIVLLGLVASAVLTSLEIPILKAKQFKQYIREEGPESHKKKSGTPTMGGVAIILALLLVTILGGYFTAESVVMLLMTLLFGAIGFLDDFIKVTAKHNLGLTAKQKLALQVLFAVGLAIYIARFSGYGTSVYIPFWGIYLDFGWFYVPFVAFVVVAMANSVNLTDGLDGLCAGITAIVSFFFALIGMKLGQGSPTIFSAALAGTCLGFLVFNRYPARLFMGDTGSMALGGAVAAAAIMMKMEFLLVIAGFVYVMESLSVIIQVVYFKKTGGKRIFRMSPIHHHFELGGMKEQNVVLMFWAVTLVCCALAYFVFMIGR